MEYGIMHSHDKGTQEHGVILIPFLCDYGSRIIPKYVFYRTKHFLYLIIWSIFVSIHN